MPLLLASVIQPGQQAFFDRESAMSAAVDRLPRIGARDCRNWVAEHCDVEVVAAVYARTYLSVALERAVRGLAHA